MKRRDFIKTGLATGAGISAGSMLIGTNACSSLSNPSDLFSIALDPWSLRHDFLFGAEYHVEFSPLDYPSIARDLGFNMIYHDNLHFPGKMPDMSYVNQMKLKCDEAGVKSPVIMLGVLGDLTDRDSVKRKTAVENHKRWAEVAMVLECESIRVVCGNIPSSTPPKERSKYAAESMRALCEFGEEHELNFMIENHQSNSSDPDWLISVMEQVDHSGCGIMPDFNEWLTNPETGETYPDRYKGVEIMGPYIKSVCASVFEYDELGNARRTDFYRMMKIILESGFRGPVALEYLGSHVNEREGIRLGKKLLERTRQTLFEEEIY